VQRSEMLEPPERGAFWADALPYFCRDQYLDSALRPVEIIGIRHGTFEYIWDRKLPPSVHSST
jgi:hypothetical protein